MEKQSDFYLRILNLALKELNERTTQFIEEITADFEKSEKALAKECLEKLYKGVCRNEHCWDAENFKHAIKILAFDYGLPCKWEE